MRATSGLAYTVAVPVVVMTVAVRQGRRRTDRDHRRGEEDTHEVTPRRVCQGPARPVPD